MDESSSWILSEMAENRRGSARREKLLSRSRATRSFVFGRDPIGQRAGFFFPPELARSALCFSLVRSGSIISLENAFSRIEKPAFLFSLLREAVGLQRIVDRVLSIKLHGGERGGGYAVAATSERSTCPLTSFCFLVRVRAREPTRRAFRSNFQPFVYRSSIASNAVP